MRPVSASSQSASRVGDGLIEHILDVHYIYIVSKKLEGFKAAIGDKYPRDNQL